MSRFQENRSTAKNVTVAVAGGNREEACSSALRTGAKRGCALRRDSGSLKRLVVLGEDLLVLLVAGMGICMMAFLMVCLFRIGNVGRSIVEALSACSGFLSAVSWPLLIVLLVVLHRRQFVRVLDALPWFVRNYARGNVVSPAVQTDEAGKSSTESEQTGDAARDPVPAEEMSEKPTEDALTVSRPAKLDVSGVLKELQKELGTPIYGDVNLFSNRTFRFDGAIVGGDGVTGIVIRDAAGVDHVRELRRLAGFYNAISEKDRRDFTVLYCVVGNREGLSETLCRVRDELGVPMEFQFRERENGFRP